MKPLKCIAVDDEPLALRQIKSYIGKTPSLELVGTFTNAPAAREFLERETIDLLFVDINMPILNGLDFVRELKQKYHVIFTTAYSEFAIDGFRLEAVDYLLKPFSLNDFQNAVKKACSLCELLELARNRESESRNRESSPINEALPEGPEFLSIKADYKTTLIRISEIVYIESEGEYVRLHLANGSALMTLFRLKNMESALPSEHFMRIHRSFIVNLNYIASYAKGRVYLSDEEYLPIGDNYRAAFLRHMDENF